MLPAQAMHEINGAINCNSVATLQVTARVVLFAMNAVSCHIRSRTIAMQIHAQTSQDEGGLQQQQI